MKFKELKISILKDFCDNLTDFFDSIGISGYYEILYDSEKKDKSQIIQDNTSLYIYIDETDIQLEVKILIFLKANIPEQYFLETRIVELKEFEDSYKEHYKPFSVGDVFWVIPVWEKESFYLPQNTIPIYLNPGMAFGTGQHETTKLMLKHLEILIKKDWNVLDMGAGSGVLSIASARMGAKKVISIDIDPNAIKASAYNIAENFPFPGNTFFLEEGSFDHPILAKNHFDVVLANITFTVIHRNIDYIKNLNSSLFLFSGVLTEKRNELIKLLLQNLGGELTFEDSLNDWMILEWKR